MKAAQDYGVMKENPEFVPLCLQKTVDAFTWFQYRKADIFLVPCRCLVHGANICAFLNIAQAMTDQGCV
jgi:glutamate dehydrogenase (NADP+)